MEEVADGLHVVFTAFLQGSIHCTLQRMCFGVALEGSKAWRWAHHGISKAKYRPYPHVSRYSCISLNSTLKYSAWLPVGLYPGPVQSSAKDALPGGTVAGVTQWTWEGAAAPPLPQHGSKGGQVCWEPWEAVGVGSWWRGWIQEELTGGQGRMDLSQRAPGTSPAPQYPAELPSPQPPFPFTVWELALLSLIK